MADHFAKYPLVQKAYDEQKGIARFLGGDLSAEHRDLIDDYVDIAENFLDGTAEEKEAVMVGCILLTGSPYVFDDVRRFATDYSPEVNDMVHDILSNAREQFSVPVQQAIGLINLSTLKYLRQDVAANRVDLNDFLPIDGLASSHQTPLLEQSAPRLHAELIRMQDAVMDAAKTAASKPAADSFKPGNPSPV